MTVPSATSRTNEAAERNHGRPHYYECTVEGCTRDGHKCYRRGCQDPLHTHPPLLPGEVRVQGWDRIWSRLTDRFDR